ncbi:MAG TPA: GNAT family N-acetyltransferase [Thermoplasmata archaeon]|nr:GNAT family N-acetyltransferase [Thermoplasmata archaeon]
MRPATARDVPAITAIYNDAVRTTTATFDLEPRSLAAGRGWFRSHGRRHPVLVAVRDGVIVGWASLSPWSDRPAYDRTAEVSVYVDAGARGRGIGRRLLARLVREGGRRGLHTLLARVADGNAVSLRLHTSLGFVRIGVMREVGTKFGRLLDVHLLQRTYPTRSSVRPRRPGGSGSGRRD